MTQGIDKTEFDTNCYAVLDSNANEYARTYANAGIHSCYSQEAMKTQALYILNNITHWRQPNAASVRKYFKEVGGVK